MRRTVSAMEARKKFGELLESVYYRGDLVTIERAGKPMAVFLPVAEYEAFEEQRREEERREEGKRKFFEALDLIRQEIGEHSEEEVMADVAAAIKAVRAEG